MLEDRKEVKNGKGGGKVWCVFECVGAFETGCQWSVVTVRQAFGPQGPLSQTLSTSG